MVALGRALGYALCLAVGLSCGIHRRRLLAAGDLQGDPRLAACVPGRAAAQAAHRRCRGRVVSACGTVT